VLKWFKYGDSRFLVRIKSGNATTAMYGEKSLLKSFMMADNKKANSMLNQNLVVD
jgi:hypothetical protein